MIEQRTLQRVGEEVLRRFLVPKFEALKMNATGEWKKNLQIRTIEDGFEIWGRDYTEYLTKGREPGKPPPIAPLQKWAVAKIGLSDTEARGFAFALSKKIAKKGTSWHREGGSDLLEVLESQEVKDYIISEIQGELSVFIAERLRREFL